MQRQYRALSAFSFSCVFLTSAVTYANDITTSFEFTDLSGQFTLGTSPHSVTFSDGEAKSIGVFSLYHTGVSAWMTSPGGIGTITFETPADQVDLFLRDQSSSVNGVLTVFDTDDQAIASVDATAASWTTVSLLRDPTIENPIKRITLQHNGTTGHTVIDDFGFCAATAGGAPVNDPVPNPLPKGAIHIVLQPVTTGLTAPNWGIPAPGQDGRLFVSDQDGILWTIDLATGNKSVFLDVTARLVLLGIFGADSFDERGLLGLAFHPDFATDGLLYTYTSEPLDGPADFSTMPEGTMADHHSVITEWQVPEPGDPASVVDPGSARELLRIDEPQFNHNAGGLNFGPDGMLYISLGDGGGADDMDGQDFFGSPLIGHGPNGNGRDPSNVLGTILRIDPDGAGSANGQYGIPVDNPFVGQTGFVDEIHAYGFRNPFRFSFDSLTGDLYLGDVGQNDLEEIDLVTAGGNYGWNHKEGSFFFDPNGVDPGFVTNVNPGVPSDLVDPVAEYDHDEGLAIIGGFVYRGRKIPALSGRYVFGDFAQTFANDGRLFYLDAGGQVVEFELCGRAALDMSLLGFAQDSDGELYVLANASGTPFGDTGVVLRIATKPADNDADGDVDLDDFAVFAGCVDGPATAPQQQCTHMDVNMDDAVDLRDVGVVQRSFTDSL